MVLVWTFFFSFFFFLNSAHVTQEEGGRGKEIFLLEPWREHGPTDTSIPDFWPPEL